MILYECLALKHPFDARHQCALIMKIIQAPVPSLPRETPTELSALTMWLLSKEPRNRPSVRDILSEAVIREKLREYRLPLPAEIEPAVETNRLSVKELGATLRSNRPPLPPPATAEAKLVQGNRIRSGHPNARRSPSTRVYAYHRLLPPLQDKTLL